MLNSSVWNICVKCAELHILVVPVRPVDETSVLNTSPHEDYVEYTKVLLKPNNKALYKKLGHSSNGIIVIYTEHKCKQL